MRETHWQLIRIHHSEKSCNEVTSVFYRLFLNASAKDLPLAELRMAEPLPCMPPVRDHMAFPVDLQLCFKQITRISRVEGAPHT